MDELKAMNTWVNGTRQWRLERNAPTSARGMPRPGAGRHSWCATGSGTTSRAMIAAFLLLGATLFLGAPSIVRADAGHVGGEGHCFEVTNSTYLNVTLCSAEVVNVTLESVPWVVSFTIRAVDSAPSTDIALSGLEPNETYYRHQDGYDMEDFTADEAGNYSYTQDLTSRHHVFIDEESSTKYIRDDATGGDCTSIGTWDSGTKTCLLTTNILETIVLDAHGITLDGGGHSITRGSGSYGVYASSRSGLSIRNLVASGFSYGVYLSSSPTSTVTGNIVSVGSRGIILYSSATSTVSGNTVTVSGSFSIGIYLSSSPTSTVSGNTVAATGSSGIGISVAFSGTSTVNGNTVSAAYYGILMDVSGSSTVSGNTISSGYYGIDLDYSGSSTVTENIVSGGSLGITLYSSATSTVSGNTVSGTYYGIYAYSSATSTVSGNTIESGDYGIRLSSSGGGTVSGNSITVTASNALAIYMYYVTSMTLTGNAMNQGGIRIEGTSLSEWNTHAIDTTNTVGGKPVQYCKNTAGGTIPAGAGQVILANCSGVTVEDQEIGNVYVGIALVFSTGITIDGNTVSGTYYGIYAYSSATSTVSGNTISGGYYGIRLSSSGTSTVSGNTVTVSGSSSIGIDVYSSGTSTVSGNTVTVSGGFSIGISVAFSGTSTVNGNTVSGGSYHGIYVVHSGSSAVSGNTVSASFSGIYLEYSSLSTVSGNTMSNIASVGVYLISSGSSTVSGNTVSSAGFGIYLSSSGSSTVSSNTISVAWSAGRGVFLTSSGSSTVSGNAVTVGPSGFGIWLSSSSGSTVSDNTLSSFGYSNAAIRLDSSVASRVNGNTVKGYYYYGIYLSSSGSNTIDCNAIRDQIYGFYLQSSSSNTIYHNNVIFNSDEVFSSGSSNTWNNPSGEGNFWWQYPGLDNGAGGRTAGDGIGDTNLPWRGVDSYPLMRGATCAYNFPPEISSFTAPSKPEGTPVVYTASATDPEKYLLTYSFDFEGDGTFDVSGASNTASHTFADDFVGTARLQVSDGTTTAESTRIVTVTNVVPTTTLVRFPTGTLNPSGTPITFTANLADVGTLDTHTATWTFDGTAYPGTVSESGGSGTVMDTFTFATPVQQMTLRVTDDDGGWSQVNNLAPVVSFFSATAYWPYEGQPVSYSAGVYDPNYDPFDFGFDFQGDGTVDATGTHYLPQTVGTYYVFPDEFSGTSRVLAGDRLLTTERTAAVNILNAPPGVFITRIDPQGAGFPGPTEVFASAEGVLAEFEFNGDAQDSSGSGRHATLLGGDFVPSEYGQGLHVYLGIDPDTYDVLPMGIDWSAYAQELHHPFTVEIVFTGFGWGGYEKLLSFDDTLDEGWYTVSCGFEPWPNPGVGYWSLCPGQRHYLALVSTAQGEMDVYVDGTFFGSSASGLPPNLDEAIFFRDDTATSRWEQLDAVVDALRISGVARSADEIAMMQRRLQGIAPPVPVGTTVSFTGGFWDAGILDTHTATWTFDTITTPGVVAESGGSGTVTGTYTFTSPGVYPVTLTVTDDDGGVGTSTYVNGLTALVVVYDPDGGFVTGGGWINSPAGAYLYDPSATGKATFGFVAKYQKGNSQPGGNTEFRFQAGDLYFQSTSYQWLVVAGPKAMFKGYGTFTIGHGPSQWQREVGFLVTAIDGDLPGGGGVDRFRIKIWDRYNEWEVIYDNMRDWPDDAHPPGIGGGRITIQKP